MRYLLDSINEFITEKFVLLSGPRQVGKTTLAKHWLQGEGKYLNWDVAEDRQYILKEIAKGPPANKLVFDELHKYRRWKSWLKGFYDQYEDRLQALVTGSARLDIYQKGGDSLLGRYEGLRLHPLSVGELTHGKLKPPPENVKGWLSLENKSFDPDLWKRLVKRGGFPEPFYKNNTRQHQRWINSRRDLLIREDLRDLSDIREVSLVEHLALLLPERVSGVLSVNSLREELSVAHATVDSWLRVLERLYYCYFLSPYVGKVARSLKKERKLYLWDWSEIEDEGARFENMVASHLLKSVHAWSDLGYGKFSLHYWRDKQKREVDFVIAKRNKPQLLIECKLSDTTISDSLLYLHKKLEGLPAIQLVGSGDVEFTKGKIKVVSAAKFLAALS